MRIYLVVGLSQTSPRIRAGRLYGKAWGVHPPTHHNTTQRKIPLALKETLLAPRKHRKTCWGWSGPHHT